MSRASAEVRPRLWVEAALLAAGYGLYSLIRDAAPPHEQAAVSRARQLLALEHRLHIDVEPAVNYVPAKVRAHQAVKVNRAPIDLDHFSGPRSPNWTSATASRSDTRFVGSRE